MADIQLEIDNIESPQAPSEMGVKVTEGWSAAQMALCYAIGMLTLRGYAVRRVPAEEPRDLLDDKGAFEFRGGGFIAWFPIGGRGLLECAKAMASGSEQGPSAFQVPPPADEEPAE